MISRRWLWGIALGFWTVVAIQSVAWRFYWTQFTVRPVPLFFIIRAEILMFGIAASLTPAILHVEKTFPLRRRGWPVSLALHSLAGAVFALSVKLLWDLAILPMYATPWVYRFSWPLFQTSLLSGVQVNVLLYWVIVIGRTAIRHWVHYQSKTTEAAELRAQLAEAQLQALRMQLDPHFLFNTLHSISGLVHADPGAAEEMIADLSELLRRSLAHHERQEILLSEELAFLRLYLDIQMRRFEGRLVVRYEIADAASVALVPAMVLQPLVENSIRHAIAPRRGGGTVLIRAGVENSRLVLEVEDFVGQPAEPPAKEGIGLGITRQRLEQLYSGVHRFELFAGTEGLCVRLSLPYHREAPSAC